MLQFLLDRQGDMVERGLIIAAIVAVAIAVWMSIGNKLADKLRGVEGQL
jgi:Flp pilus assembly pilin Flp